MSLCVLCVIDVWVKRVPRAGNEEHSAAERFFICMRTSLIQRSEPTGERNELREGGLKVMS